MLCNHIGSTFFADPIAFDLSESPMSYELCAKRMNHDPQSSVLSTCNFLDVNGMPRATIRKWLYTLRDIYSTYRSCSPPPLVLGAVIYSAPHATDKPAYPRRISVATSTGAARCKVGWSLACRPNCGRRRSR